MKKLIIFAIAVATTLCSCGVEDNYYGKEVNNDPESNLDTPYEIKWGEVADRSTGVLVDRFMNKTKGTFWSSNEDYASGSQFCYWPQAHAMDVVVDAYLRIKDSDAERKAQYENYMSLWHQNRANNYSGPAFKNNFTDDMQWIVLTLMRMYEATGEQKYLTSAKDTYDQHIITRWATTINPDDPNGGGLRWYYDSGKPLENPDGKTYSVNACSNGPGALIACRLYMLTNEEQYKTDAIRIYNWLVSTLYNPKTGLVADNMCNGIIGGGALSYNQGTFLGSAHLLYKITGDKKYLHEAIKATQFNMSTEMTIDNVMRNEGEGDNALFKGIFIRYAAQLAIDKSVDAAFRKTVRNFIIFNGNTCWLKGVDTSEESELFFSASWSEYRTGYGGSLNEQVSASTLIEAVNVVK